MVEEIRERFDWDIFNFFMRKKAREQDRDGEVVRWPLFVNCNRREFDNHAMMWEMQACLFDSSLHSVTAYLECGVRYPTIVMPGPKNR